MDNQLLSQYKRYYMDNPQKPTPSKWLDRVQGLAKIIGAKTILDYGCGQTEGLSFLNGPNFTVQSYDPAIPGLNSEPRPADLVTSIHMLEHVEPWDIGATIAELNRLALKGLLIVVSLQASTKTLPDGSPWHRSVFDADYWANVWFHAKDGYQPSDPLKGLLKEDSKREFVAYKRMTK